MTVKNILNIIKIFVPVLLIIACMIEITKIIAGDVEKQAENKKKIINKILAAIVVFLVPTFVNMIMNYLAGTDIESTSCWKNANQEYITKLKAQEEEIAKDILVAEETEREKTYEQKKKESLELRKKIQASSSIGSASVGEVAGIPLNQRMNKLFPAGVPTTKQQMEAYLTTIEVTTIDKSGSTKTRKLTVHKYLANEVKAIFDELLKIKFPISDAYSYSWRNMASGTGSKSHHSYGVAIDINASSNAASYTGGSYRPGKDPYSVTSEVVNIWKKHGFYWGGDWSGYYFDPMHFTYTNH